MMEGDHRIPTLKTLIISLYIPWILAELFSAAPDTSYIIAWLGSLFIFYQTWFSSYRFILPDLPRHKQIMRPLFLQQFIFAGFMCCTSIFFYVDTIGYRYFEQVHNYTSEAVFDIQNLIAKCQRYSLLGHAALTTGILIIQKNLLYKLPEYKPPPNISSEVWIIRIGATTLGASLFIQMVPGLEQFAIGLYNVSLFCGAVLFVNGIRKNQLRFILWGGSIFIFNIIKSTLSGFKEPILINFIILTCLFFPYYRKLVLTIAVPLFVLLFYSLSIYTNVFRQHAWQGEASAEEARTEAFGTVLEEYEEDPMQQSNWEFLTDRFSEIGMFTQYVESTPEQIPFYYTEILQNALLSVIPRALWKDKPHTETLAMERVYLADVIDRRSNVSAKTRPVVDGYLSGGGIGIFLYMFLIGAFSQLLNNKAERLFGGYHIGSIIIFNGFFQLLWRGEAIEFLINSVFWSFVAMMVLYSTLKYFNYLIKVGKP